jgi:hypothetical protein
MPFPEDFTPNPRGTKDCDGILSWAKYPNFDWIARSITGDTDYPDDYEGCRPKLQSNALFDNLRVTTDVQAATFTGGNFTGTFNGTINVQSWKGFDIKHPNKENHRLRHICLEGPEAGVYFRGRLNNSNVIEIPPYWEELVDPDSVTVTLTQIGYSQDLIVDKIDWCKNIVVRSGNDSNIDCFYVVQGSRTDGEKLIVEYEGATPADYPGSSAQFSISGYDYGAKGVDRAD